MEVRGWSSIFRRWSALVAGALWARWSLVLVCVVLLAGAAAALRAQDHPGTAGSPEVYVGLGASDTVGVGADDPATEGWVPVVHAGLPNGTALLNLGISGATLDDVLQQELPPALDARPRWVTLWSGVNDLSRGVSLPSFAAQLDDILGQLRASADGRQLTIVVLNIPNLRHLPVFGARELPELDATVQAWNAAITDAAARHDAILVDLYHHWPELAEHPEYISGDGFHPSTVGYQRIAALVLNELEVDVSSNAP